MGRITKSILSIVLVIALLIPTGSMMFTVNAQDSSFKVGDTIEFGTYPQSAIKDNDGNITGYKEEPIEWIVLNITDGKALLLSKEIIDGKTYNSTSATVNGYYGNNYVHSDVRKWLIEDFYNIAFTTTEQNAVIPTVLDNAATDSKYSSESTTDNIFLLSKSEAETYACNYYSTTATDYAYSNGFEARTSTESCNQWRLRTARSNYYEIYKVEIRWGKWTVYYNWYDDEISTINGIRPAFYLDIEKYENEIKGNGLKLYSTHSSNYLSVGDRVDIIIGNYKDDNLDTSVRDFITVISDSDVIDITKGDWNSDKGETFSNLV